MQELAFRHLSYFCISCIDTNISCIDTSSTSEHISSSTNLIQNVDSHRRSCRAFAGCICIQLDHHQPDDLDCLDQRWCDPEHRHLVAHELWYDGRSTDWSQLHNQDWPNWAFPCPGPRCHVWILYASHPGIDLHRRILLHQDVSDCQPYGQRLPGILGHHVRHFHHQLQQQRHCHPWRLDCRSYCLWYPSWPGKLKHLHSIWNRHWLEHLDCHHSAANPDQRRCRYCCRRAWCCCRRRCSPLSVIFSWCNPKSIEFQIINAKYNDARVEVLSCAHCHFASSYPFYYCLRAVLENRPGAWPIFGAIVQTSRAWSMQVARCHILNRTGHGQDAQAQRMN